MTNYDFLKTLTIEEMAELLSDTSLEVEHRLLAQLSAKYPQINVTFIELPEVSYQRHLAWLAETVKDKPLF